jgi:MoxR-like ATPase
VVRPWAAVGTRSRSSSRWMSSSIDNDNADDRSISIGNVLVDAAPRGSGRRDLVPTLLTNDSRYIPSCHMSHLRWMLQKDLSLQQDFLLLGPPSLARDRRHLLFLYAALVEREVEYVALSRDTSDADLKQRKEVSGHESVYVNQAPVRAALHGRLLILDGLEKAERNVLPTLNNLLENRELSLDDGGLLVSPQVFDDHDGHNQDASSLSIHRVHPDFRVAALASEATLDPPLRSRFQARMANFMDPGEMLYAVAAAIPDRTLGTDTIKELVGLAANIPEGMSLQSVHDAARYLERNPNNLSSQTAMNAYSTVMMGVEDIMGNLSTQLNQSDSVPLASSSSSPISTSTLFMETKTTQAVQDLVMSAFESGKRAVAIVGPKGCYKSALARQLSRRNGTNVELFSLYSDMTARDLLLTRGTDLEGNTVWRNTPLTRAAQKGSWVILDGIDKISTDTLTSLALLMEQGQVDLPDGTRLQAGQGFRCIALAHPPDAVNWMAPEVAGMFHFVRVDPLPSDELKTVLSGLYPSLDSESLSKSVNLRDRLDSAIRSGAADTLDEQESLLLSLRKIKHICKRVEQRGSEDLPRLIQNALMTSLMPDRERRIVQACMKDCGITGGKQAKRSRQQRRTGLDEELLEQCRRTPKHPLLVPNPIFEENPGHSQVLGDILDAHSVGEGALLIMGFQGVGKNRVIDYLLSRLQCEREYLQLHRDTTVQSLLSSPSVENGRIVYGDSPLVRAAKNGRILVVDEADKAPVEVVALLKGLIEDRELALPGGRTLRYESDSSPPNEDTVEIHPDFRVWALANPATYPFHGNDISGEMSDVFSCHTVPPLDAESQKRILQSYGPGVSERTIDKIIDIWQDLRNAHEKGVMAYPFSVREAVSVTKHLDRFPADGLEGAFENVISFDRFDNIVLKQLATIFSRHGVPVAVIKNGTASTAGTEGGVSTPKTRTSSPKHGKFDEKNDPHVGGNTWAGGSGGSDTAGLGGRGGPYRLDSGHPVHQVSDEMKAEVSEEAQKRARQMAREGLEQKLKGLNMGELDWERYNHLQNQVAVEIQQLQVLLKDIKRRKQERVWLKRQSTGELDDSRLVDALAGEKDVFKRRGTATDTSVNSTQATEPMAIKLVVDVSASMYRFNGYDGRLQRLLEATLMIMESLKDDDRFALTIVGHNGDSAEIPLFRSSTPQDPKTQLKVLESMVAHTQYTLAGDSTLEAIELAISQAREGDLVLVITDANLQRYRIDPADVSDLLKRKDVHAHLVLIGGFGEEANKLSKAIPNERAQVCLDSEDLPLIIKNIVASAAK